MVLKIRSVKRLAIVGLGSIGRRHLRILKELRPEIKVVLVRSGNGVRWPEETLASLIVFDIRSAIDIGVDAAIISSPSPFHLEQANIFLDSNIPLLIEKPLSISAEGLDTFKRRAQSKSITLLVGYVLRYSAGARHLRKLIQENHVGEVTSANIKCMSWLPDWRPAQDYRNTVSARANLGGGVLLELSHELDFANWLFGPFEIAKATLSNSGLLDIDVEDSAKINLLSKAGQAVSVHLDFSSKQIIRETTVIGLSGTLSWNLIENRITLIPAIGDIMEWSLLEERDDMYRGQLIHFLDSIEHGDEPEVTLEDGITVMKLIDSARRSNQVHAPIRI